MNIRTYGVRYLLIGLLILTAVIAQHAHALTVTSTAKTESALTPIIKRTKPLARDKSKDPKISSTSSLTSKSTTTEKTSLLAQTSTLGPNLIQNPSFESIDSNGNPIGWHQGGWGTNTPTYTFPATGNDGSNAATVAITNYQDGDAKWYFDEVPVTAGSQYQFSDYSFSNTSSEIDIRYTMSDGSFTYGQLAILPASAAFQGTTVKITAPANAVSLTIFHVIAANGSLTVDTYSLNEITGTTTPPSTVPNGDFETSGVASMPDAWNKGGWGTNTSNFTYPVTGVDGSQAAKVTLSSYSSGDAKWYFDPIALEPGLYTYTDQYISDIPSTITVQFENTDGSFSYSDIKTLPAAASFTAASADFTVGTGVKSITIFHLIQAVGSLTLDNVAVASKAAPGGVFATGAVTLRFDDGELSQYQNAIPKMNAAGMLGTFYIVSRQIANDGYAGYMSKAQIKNIFKMGDEIGAHTRTHPYLSTLSDADQQTEIAGSRSDLLAWNVGPITSFAYPYGDYNLTTLSIVQNAGFTNAASTIDGFVTPTSDRYQLEYQGVVVTTTLADVEAWVDNAILNKDWLILTFHRIDNSGDTYSTTPETFSAIIDYIKSKNIPVVTASQGASSIQ